MLSKFDQQKYAIKKISNTEIKKIIETKLHF